MVGMALQWPLRDTTSPAFALSKSINGELFTLVFSDEFNQTIRPGGYNTTTTPGRHEKWSATANLDTDAQGQTFLDPGQLQAANGTLIVTGVPGTVSGSQWLGGQLSTWNRVCFQGGYLEVRYRSPGSFGENGLWPAIWTLGNLARDTYPSAMTSGFWPWSYDDCTFPTPGELYGSRQAKSACSSGREADGLHPQQGRGAIELDLLEYIQCSHQWGSHLEAAGALRNGTCLLQSIQIAPRLPPAYRPFIGEDPTPGHPWYGGAVTRSGGDGWEARQHGQMAVLAVPCLGSALARLLCLLRARLAAMGSSALPGRGRPAGRLGTASGARASRLQSRRFHCV